MVLGIVLLALAMGFAETGVVSTRHEIARAVAMPGVHAALRWFSERARQVTSWQIELTRIPAPPFREAQRAEWLRQRFVELGLQDVHIDKAGNVIGVRPGTAAGKFVAITAHIDTVFPDGTEVEITRQGTKLFGPGVSDNASGVAAMLAVIGALQAGGLQTQAPMLFVGNVGEEGEGDLRGMRYLFGESKYADQIAYTLVIDGGGTDTIITDALGSRRFAVTAHGPGGHSWTDFGTPNPIVLLARVIDIFSCTRVPADPKTTFNIGTIRGGTSVNAIPESATFNVDLRSVAVPEIDRLEKALRAAVNEAQKDFWDNKNNRPLVGVEIREIGNRPAAELPRSARILEVVRATDEQLGIKSRLQRASTDANIPLSQGREALTVGGGGTGGGAHTLHEWYDTTNREVGLRRILVTALALAGVSE